MDYISSAKKEIQEYFKILEPDFPEWLNEYINTKELLFQQYISISCGTYYSNLFSENKFFYSNLDHSIGVALIIWHFTHDKKQTLSGLFHDIATPAFKHCVDFLNGDYVEQESTEDLTTEILKNSNEISELLKRDDIKISEVDNYHLYPIADNDTPKLSADRLEYSLANGMFSYNLLSLDEVKEIYNDIEIQKNGENEIELGFRTKALARKLVKVTSIMSVIYREDRTRYSMQFIADILKRLNNENKIMKTDLYRLKESEIIDIIEKSKYKDVFDKWKHAKKVNVSTIEPKDVYFVKLDTKIRYINPLFNGVRMYDACKIAKNMIDKNLSYDQSKYVYLDFKIE